MDASELPRMKDHISRALGDNKEAVVLQLLGRLKEFKATTDSLKSTRIGVYVTELRKHPNASDRIKTVSKDVVNKWKADIGRTNTDTPTKNGTAVATSQAASRQEGMLQPRADLDALKRAPTPTRTVATDGITVRPSGDTIRDRCTESLYTCLATGSTAAGSKVIKIIEAVEAAVFAENKATNDKYKARVRTLISNLKTNAKVRDGLLSNKISPERFAVMSIEELMSDDRKAEVERARQESIQDAVSATDNQSETDMFKCGRCGARKTKYYQMQTRSADEPMTTFVTCVNCGNKWKFC
ncbi:transcription elongation factor TFIIS [Polyrhizophydium stewartii]|uniref:Transcription elongation factor n=1 Tax=Polyrhizophydium stewartii TaxID=2732419 RepID=A0ABR4N9W2_9FUNG